MDESERGFNIVYVYRYKCSNRIKKCSDRSLKCIITFRKLWGNSPANRPKDKPTNRPKYDKIDMKIVDK